MTLTRTLASPLLLLAAALAPAQQMTRPARPTPPAGGYLVLKADLHLHTVFSDGVVWPDVRVLEAWKDSLDVVAVSDHDDYRPHEKDVNMDLERPYQIARPVAEGLGMLIIPAVEITKGDIHFNALFVRDHNAFRGQELQAALTEAKRQGAFSFWNHPGWKGKAVWWSPIATAYSDKLFQGIEVVNGASYYEEAHPWLDQHSLAIIGNSDIHAAAVAGDVRTQNLIFARERTLPSVREALEARRTAVWQGKSLYGGAELLASLWRAYVKTPAQVRPAPGSRNIALQLENISALPFDLRLIEAPAWLQVRNVTVGGLQTAIVQMNLTPKAPAGSQRVRLRWEVANATIAAGKRLEVPMEFEFDR